MVWQILAGAALGAATEAMSGRKQFAAIQDKLERSNVALQSKVSSAGNRLTAAQGALSRWTQAMNNQRALQAGADALESNMVNYWRSVDAAASNNLAQSIRAAEEAGGRMAAAAANGVAGEVVDSVNSTVRLRDAIMEQQTKDYAAMAQYDTLRRAAGIAQQAVSSMDNSLILDSLNYNTATARLSAPTTSYGSAALQGGLGVALQMAASGAFGKETKTPSSSSMYSLTSDGPKSFTFAPPTPSAYRLGGDD